MTPAEHGRELLQKWSLVKSDSGWWICRNDIPFLWVRTLADGQAYLSKFNLECKDIDDRQRELTADDFRSLRETKMRMYDGLVK